MKNKGFTLIELLAVIIILVVIFLLVFPSVNKIIKQSKDVVYDKQVKRILESAYDFTLTNLEYLPNKDEIKYITLAQLKSEGLIDYNIKNSNSNEEFPNELVISIKNVGGGYKYSDQYAFLKGDYLYKVEFEYDSYEESKQPTIVLDSLVPNSDGNYVTSINLNDTFNLSNYTATSYDGIDITDKVVINIMNNNSICSSVDTSKFGIYYIYYTVVDDKGFSKTVVRYVIIGDNEAPVIILPEKTEIKKGTVNFDFMDDVSCTDNSGFCDISVLSQDNFDINVPGTYIIQYTSKDPTGNTKTKKRVISIVE